MYHLILSVVIRRLSQMEQVEIFIEKVKNNQALWNFKHVDYKNRKKKTEMWKKIAEDVNMTVEDCKKKWKGLRDSFSRENLKRLTSGQETGDHEGWHFYHHMEFLKDVTKPRATKSNYTPENRAEEGTISLDVSQVMDPQTMEPHLMESPPVVSEDEVTSLSPRTPCQFEDNDNTYTNKRRRSRHNSYTIEENLLQTMCNLNTFFQRYTNNDDDEEDSLFCRSLVKKLQKFPEDKRNDLKIKMLQMLNEEQKQFMSQV